MNIKITLNPKSRQALAREKQLAFESKNISWYRRLLAIELLQDHQHSPQEVAVLLSVTPRCIYNWVSDFLLGRFDALRVKHPPGRPSRLNAHEKQMLKSMILQGPEVHGYQTGVWTCVLLQDLIEQYFGVSYSPGYISQLLRSLDLRHKKVQSISHKADKEAQLEWIEKTLPELLAKAHQENALVFYQDESTAQMWTKASYSWGTKGEPIEVKTHMSSTRQKVYGAIELNSGELIWMFSKKSNHQEFLQFIKNLLRRFKGKKVYMIIDNGPIHQGPVLDEYLQRNSHLIELVRLPAYSPQLNPIERLWKELKKLCLHNRFFADKTVFLKELKKGLRFFQGQPSVVLSLMKKWFWLSQQIKRAITADFYTHQQPDYVAS